MAPELFARRGTLSVLGGWREATQVGFYGFGMIVEQGQPRQLQLHSSRTVERTLEVFPTQEAVPRARRARSVAVEPGPGSGDAPSVEQVYTPETLPGLGAQPVYLHTQGTVGIDSRPARGYARRGGFYGVTFHDYTDTDSAIRLQPDRLRSDPAQSRSCARPGCCRSARSAQTTYDKNGQQIPFFMMPSSAAAPPCARTRAGASATSTACCCRRSGASWSTGSSTWRCSTTPARSRRSEAIWTCTA